MNVLENLWDFFGSDNRLYRTIRKNVRDPHGMIMSVGDTIVPHRYVDYAIQYCVSQKYDTTDQINVAMDIPLSGKHYISGTWEDAVEIMMVEDIDTVFLMDIIRFIDKKDAKDLLEITKVLVKNQIVLVTPITKDQRSVWTFRDLQKHGWHIWMFGDTMLAIYTVPEEEK